ncbi:MAG TPA: peptidoglycan-binding domain-containing protein [Hyphomicrobiales bacterium]|nr:peptidoglycan-binding domain-containing protein [Hyphomicrobiales bacterium]
MTPFKARLAFFSVMAVFLATAGNALFLQDRTRLLQGNTLPSTAISLTQLPPDKSNSSAAGTGVGIPKGASTSSASLRERGTRDGRLYSALERELALRGYGEQLKMGTSGLRLAVLAYEFDNGLPLTGQPTNDLLKRVLFNQNQAPRGAFADRAENNQKLVAETQKSLLELGFFRGTLSSRVDVWTESAIKDFERHRGLPITGRLNEATLLELILYSGQQIVLSSN